MESVFGELKESTLSHELSIGWAMYTDTNILTYMIVDTNIACDGCQWNEKCVLKRTA